MFKCAQAFDSSGVNSHLLGDIVAIAVASAAVAFGELVEIKAVLHQPPVGAAVLVPTARCTIACIQRADAS